LHKVLHFLGFIFLGYLKRLNLNPLYQILLALRRVAFGAGLA
jgi:hypothetical protein